MTEVTPLIVIVGPTASGKTALAIKLAKRFGGEIVSADSRAVYKGLDIGTAKPSLEERGEVSHWGIDLIEPNERFTAVDFQAYANRAICEIRARGHVPFLVGGTGLYIDSIVYDYQFPEGVYDSAVRSKLEAMSIEALHEYCDKNNIQLPENILNKRYVVNNILRSSAKPKRSSEVIPNTIVVGIATDKSILASRIESRVNAMWNDGLIKEAREAAVRYGWECGALSGNAYRIARSFLLGDIDKDQALARIMTLDRQLAKRQLTWFRRNEHTLWMPYDDAYTYLAQVLAAHLDS